MSREIKFRIWDNVDKKIIYPTNIAIYDTNKFGWYCPKIKSSSHQSEKDGHVLMQYTGLKDKNAVEIYEDDIIQLKDGVATVDWYKCGFYFKYLVPNNRGEWVDILVSDTKVIGNIHENQDLLK